MRRRRLLRTTAVGAILAAGIAAAQDAPPTKEPPAPAGPQDPPPADATPPFEPPAILAQRRKGLKEPAANAAVAAGLDWLRRHQSNDGRWDCDEFDAVCKGAACSEPGMPDFDPGVTGLAVLAFLGAGATHVEGTDAARLAKALEYLRQSQDSEGCFGPRTSQSFQYNHRVATMAVAEALWLTGDKRLLGPATKALDFLHASQNPYLGWRYGIRDGDNDTSATAYTVLALGTCEFARLDVDRGAYVGAAAWLEKMTDPETGRVGYQQRGGLDARAWANLPPAEKPKRPDPPKEPREPGGIADLEPIPNFGGGLQTGARRDARSVSYLAAPDHVLARYPDDARSALTAAAGAAMTVVGHAESAPLVEKWAWVVAIAPPSSGVTGFLDLHYMLYGSLFDAQRTLDVPPKDATARKSWRSWRDSVVADLVEAQRAKADGCAAGSWDASPDPFGIAGGRVYSTSMAILALQAPNRFPRVWDPKAKPPKPPRPGKR